MASYDLPRRDFDPTVTGRYGKPTKSPDRLVKYSPKWKYSRLFHHSPYHRGMWRPRMLTIVIAVDGASRGNNRADPNSRGAYGVFFGPKCFRNTWGLLDRTVLQTNSRAELEAVHQALLAVKDMKHAGEFDGWREIIIKTDSDYVARSFDEWVWNWENNGYKSSKGKPVAHSDLIQRMHRMICKFEDYMNLSIRFWRVPRKFNADADALANFALDEQCLASLANLALDEE